MIWGRVRNGVVVPDGEVQLPEGAIVRIFVRTSEGILVQPCPKVTWDEIFETDLSVRPGDAAAAAEIADISGDDLLFQADPEAVKIALRQ